MIESTHLILQWLRTARRRGQTLFLLFDYDGTLVPICEHPDLAVLPPTTRDALNSLAGEPGVRLGIISGRALANLKQMVEIAGIDYAGTNGLELEFSEVAVQHPQAGRMIARIEQLKDELQRVASPYEGAWIEVKPFGLTVHYRQVVEERVGELKASLQKSLESLAEGFRVLPGPMAVEIVPDLGWSKGTAVRIMIGRAGDPATVACYFGDHANDADAFEAVTALGGLSVGVGDSAPGCARFRLEDSQALGALLDQLLVGIRSEAA